VGSALPPEMAVLVNAAAGRGRAARVLGAVTEALTTAGVRPRLLTVGDRTDAEQQVAGAVGNTPWYGGGLRIAPAADPADGLLEVVVVGPISRRELVRTRPRLAAGTHVDHPAVTVLRGREVTLHGTGLTTYADGEPVCALPAVSVCVPGALRLIGTARR
jgi:diacylglycerol kinase (ATP)